MKKQLLSLAVLMMGAALFTACDDNDDNHGTYVVPVTKGAFLVCSGNSGKNIGGSLSYLDYSSGMVGNQQFQQKNGRALGTTPNDVLVYGTKMYIAVTGENTIEVVDAKTLSSIRQIKTDQVFGEGCLKPRHFTAADGLVYVSFYGSSASDWSTGTTTGNGCVVAMDTVSYAKQNIYQAGSFPEGLSVLDNTLYVANSDYAACNKPSISMINITTRTSTELKNENIVNPTKVVLTNAGDMYILDMGNYDDKAAGVLKVNANTKAVTRLLDATDMACVGSNIFTFNAPYGATTITYSVYNILNQSKTIFYEDNSKKIFSPACIGVDPVTGSVLIASYQKDPDTGRTGYALNSLIYMFAAQYDNQGIFTQATPSATVFGKEAGVGPTAFAFKVDTEKIEY